MNTVPGTHNGARWSELALTPGSHLGPFNDLQIYHPCLGELANTSWGRCHGLPSASDHSGRVSPGSLLWDSSRVSVLTEFTLELMGIIRWFKVALKRQGERIWPLFCDIFQCGKEKGGQDKVTHFSGLIGRIKRGCVALE